MKTQNTLYTRSQPTILWLSVWALAALQGIFTLAWVSYRVHLPHLLKPFGFSDNFAAVLLLIEALLAIAIEPLAGRISDQTQHRRGSRFPIITLGVILAAVLFIANAGFIVWVQPSASVHWVLPVMLITWGITMSLFRSPAFALLKRYASSARLVQAASLLTFTGGLAGTAAPFAKPLILGLGAPLTFTLMAVLLLGVLGVLRSLNPPGSSNSMDREFEAWSVQPQLPPVQRLSLIFGLGLTVTLVFRLATQTFPGILVAHLPVTYKPLLIGTMFVSLALTAIPGGMLAGRLGLSKTMLSGLVVLAGCFALMSFVSNAGMAFGLALASGASFSLVSNGTLPLVLSLIPSRNAGLAVGMFFSGAALATSLFEPTQSLLRQPGILSFGVGIIALIATALCVAISSILSPDLDRSY